MVFFAWTPLHKIIIQFERNLLKTLKKIFLFQKCSKRILQSTYRKCRHKCFTPTSKTATRYINKRIFSASVDWGLMSLFIILTYFPLRESNAFNYSTSCHICSATLMQLLIDTSWCKSKYYYFYLPIIYLLTKTLFQSITIDSWTKLLVGSTSSYFSCWITDTKHVKISSIYRSAIDALSYNACIFVSFYFKSSNISQKQILKIYSR